MRELGIQPYLIIMVTDSEATMKVIVTNKWTKRMKHMDLKIYSAQESFRRGKHIQNHMRGASLVVDALTKTTNPETTQLAHLKAVLVGDFWVTRFFIVALIRLDSTADISRSEGVVEESSKIMPR